VQSGLLERVCATVSRIQGSWLQAVRPELGAGERRRLVEESGDDSLFDVLFHGEEASESEFFRSCRRHALRCFSPRPGSGPGDRRQRNLAIAARLAESGEIWLALGRPEAQGHALFRAARWVEDSHLDVEALCREGNLEVIAEIQAPALDLIRAAADGKASGLVDAWFEEALG